MIQQQKGKEEIRFRSQNYMGANFQASCTAPRQRQMETISWMGSDGLFIACYNITSKQ